MGACASVSSRKRRPAGLITEEIVAETTYLMRAFMQHGHDPDVAIRQATPIDEVMLMAEVEAFHAKLCRHRP